MKFFNTIMTGTLCLLSFHAAAEWPSRITPVPPATGSAATARGSLESGVAVDNLAWAWDSNVACFPQTQASKFRGKHRFFTTQIPPNSKMDITVIPLNEQQNLSVYVYAMGMNDFYLPPKLPSAVTCEADYKRDRKRKGKQQDHTRAVSLQTARNPYKVVIGVTGPAETITGHFKLQVSIKPR
ncbi:MAG: hypothetical protein OEZ39_19340 [Gammaproteobacteria bacterium]|nr:hypothetical protein [Gammaproteobacteria bacterium]MDH5654020.1 hypothetical protein [Gammaproteobacteria bacterium]